MKTLVIHHSAINNELPQIVELSVVHAVVSSPIIMTLRDFFFPLVFAK